MGAFKEIKDEKEQD